MKPGYFHKYAKARWQKALSDEAVAELMDKLSPWSTGLSFRTAVDQMAKAKAGTIPTTPKKMRMDLRELLRGSTTTPDGRTLLHTGVYPTIPVPLTAPKGEISRLESYKRWKKTGILPGVDTNDAAEWVDPSELSLKNYGKRYKRSKTPVTLYHGSHQSEKPLRELLRRAHSTIHEGGKSSIIPGQPGLAAGGIFAVPGITKGITKRHAHGGSGKVYEMAIPRKDVLTHYKYFNPENKSGWVETLVPASAIRPKLPG